ncbi:uncharacterized protein LOC111218645 [Seriola dumerili]|uniref:uncharacterized protein LOC111218645 n=1 Tax=Seriola dumerili TaxID=41447 RepID=UPI000BBEBE90|nr:uncharacterized protein LOC111218645 [Seriola dumerili]
MTAYSFNIFIILTVYSSFSFHPSQGFKVIQPQYQTINPDGSASISCEHKANVSSVKDVRLNRVSLRGGSERSMLCQKGKTGCKNTVMYQENPNKFIFILLNIGPEATKVAYECEFTVKTGPLDNTKRGTPTQLWAGQNKTEDCVPPSPPPPAPPPPSPLVGYQLIWILIGLLALIILYSSVITYVYIRFRMTSNNKEPDNCTYVEMRKAPLKADSPLGIYCG